MLVTKAMLEAQAENMRRQLWERDQEIDVLKEKLMFLQSISLNNTVNITAQRLVEAISEVAKCLRS